MARAAANKRAKAKAQGNQVADEFDGGGWEGETPGGGDIEGDGEGGGGDSSEEGEHSDDDVWEWFWGLFKFLCFVSIFTILNVAYRPSPQINEYTTMWKSIIAAEVDDYNFVGNVWDFLSEPIVDLLSPDFFSASSGYWPEDKNQYIYGNRLLGTVRLRQVRVTNSACSPLQKYFLESDSSLQKTCFDRYKKSLDEGRNAKYPNFKRARDNESLVDLDNCAAQGCGDADGNTTRCCMDFPHFRYRTYKELGESVIDFQAAYNSYPGGGYVIDLKNNTDAVDKIAMLQRHGWIDLKTRALFVDFSFYNPNVNLFLVCRIVFEFLPSGMVKPFSTYRVVKVQPQFDFSESTTFNENVLLCVMVVLIAWLTYDEAEEIYHELKMFKWRIFPVLKSHLSDVWNICDITTLLIAYLLLYLAYLQNTVVEELMLDPNNMDASKLQNMGFWASQSTNIAGIQALVLWVKLFKFVAVTHKLEKLFEAIVKSIPAAMELLFVYFIFVLAFAVSGLIVFGNDVPLFANLELSIVSSVRVALFQDYDWDAMYASNRYLGPAWIILFMLVSGIFLINFLVGIFCEVYAEVMGEEDDGKISVLEQCMNKISDLLHLKKLHAKIADIEGRLGDMDADGDGMVSDFRRASPQCHVFGPATQLTSNVSFRSPKWSWLNSSRRKEPTTFLTPQRSQKSCSGSTRTATGISVPMRCSSSEMFYDNVREKHFFRLLLSRFCLCLLSLSFLATWTSECKVPTRAKLLTALHDVNSLVHSVLQERRRLRQTSRKKNNKNKEKLKQDRQARGKAGRVSFIMSELRYGLRSGTARGEVGLLTVASCRVCCSFGDEDGNEADARGGRWDAGEARAIGNDRKEDAAGS